MLLLRALSKQRTKITNCLYKPCLRNYSAAVIKSPFDEINIPDQTVTQFVWPEAPNWDELQLVTCGVTGRSYTYGLAKMLCKQAAMAFLKRLNLQPGDTIGLFLPNIPEYLIACHGALDAGFIVTFANPLYTAEEVQRQFADANVKCIVTIPLFIESIQIIAKKLPNYTFTINVGGKTDIDKNILGMEELIFEGHEIELPKVSSTDVAVLPYSSGTTGLPKGVMLTHRNLIANLIQVAEISGVPRCSLDDREIALSVLPFFHVMGFNSVMNMSIYYGAHLITMPRFVPTDYLKCLETYKPITLFVVPALITYLATNPEVTTEHLSSIKKIVSGAAPLSKNLINKFKKKVNRDDCIVQQGYGMTEASPVILYTLIQMPESKEGSCGKIIPSTECRLINPENGKDVTTPHTPGEIVCRGPQIMKGYHCNEQATREIIDSDGWLHTGDVAYYDEDGYFFIVDRTKELIKVKGHQVSPTELETLILEIPGVLDVAVVGIPDQFSGELPKAFVVKKPDSDVDVETINKYIVPKVAAYKKLDGGITFIDAIPRNLSGKILRRQLKAMNGK